MEKWSCGKVALVVVVVKGKQQICGGGGDGGSSRGGKTIEMRRWRWEEGKE